MSLEGLKLVGVEGKEGVVSAEKVMDAWGRGHTISWARELRAL